MQSNEAQRDLLTEQACQRGTSRVIERSYSYDALNFLLTRRTVRQGAVRHDAFDYNAHNELNQYPTS